MSAPGAEGTSPLAAIVKSLALLLAVTVGNVGRRTASMVAGYLLVAGLFTVSLCFLTLAGYRAISLAMGSIYASLLVGGAYLVVGLVAALVLQSRR